MSDNRSNRKVKSKSKMMVVIILFPVKVFFQIVGRIAPAVAARIFQYMLEHMPRKLLKQHEKDFLGKAKKMTFEYKGTALAGYSFGKGEIVLMVHGMQGSAANFRLVIPKLVQAGFKVIAFDSVRHGNSPKGIAFSRDVVEHLKQIIVQLENIHAVVSHSAGAYISMLALLDLPDSVRVKKCIYIAAAPDINWPVKTFKHYFSLPTTVCIRLRAWFELVGGISYEEQSLRACVAKHKTPTRPDCLFVYDENDEKISFEYVKSVFKPQESDVLLTTRGLGHFNLLKDSNVIREISSFLAK